MTFYMEVLMQSPFNGDSANILELTYQTFAGQVAPEIPMAASMVKVLIGEKQGDAQ